MTDWTRALLLITPLIAAGCAAEPAGVTKTGGAAKALMFETAEQYAAITVDDVTLSANGAVDLSFTAPDQVFGYAIGLEAGQIVFLETAGDPELDTVVYLFGPDDGTGFFGELPVIMDDDGGEGMLSFAGPYEIKVSGTYLAVASTFGGGGEGDAVLFAHAESPDPEGGCEAEHASCGAVLGCIIECGSSDEPEACAHGCFEAVAEEAWPLLDELGWCAEESGCGADPECLDWHCPEVLWQCVEQDPGAGGLL